MHCPFCSEEDTKVIDSRPANGGEKVRRRRQCPRCKERFTTFETTELFLPRIIKSDESRELFIEQKIRDGMHLALEKRPVTAAAIENALDAIKKSLLNCGEREISSRLVGDLVMQQLKTLDHVAYIRFASVYLSFEDVNAFKEAIDNLKKNKA